MEVVKPVKRNVLLNPGPATTSDAVKYAYMDENGWAIETIPDVAESGFTSISIALEEYDRPYIGYTTANGNLRLARKLTST